MAILKNKPGKHLAHGIVLYERTNQPAVSYVVRVFDGKGYVKQPLGKGTTNKKGEYKINFSKQPFVKNQAKGLSVFVSVYDDKDKLITSTNVLNHHIDSKPITVQTSFAINKTKSPVILTEISGAMVDAKEFESLSSLTFLKMASLVFENKKDAVIRKKLQKLLPLNSVADMLKVKSKSDVLHFFKAIFHEKGWSRDVYFKFERRFGLDPRFPFPSPSLRSIESDNFIVYYTVGVQDSVDQTDAGSNVIEPGTNQIIAHIKGLNGFPDYVERIIFWLEHSLKIFTTPPFSLRNPVLFWGRKIEVTIGAKGDSAAGTNIWLRPGLDDDYLSRVVPHECHHVVQGTYKSWPGPALWYFSLEEGGARMAEDTVIKRRSYLGEFKFFLNVIEGQSLMFGPGFGGNGSPYAFSSVLKYICEQCSPNINPADEPFVGIETYRMLLEERDNQPITTKLFRDVIDKLPWHQTFCDFTYNRVYAGQFLQNVYADELISSETIIGNYILACYLKNFGANIPDRRFGFMGADAFNSGEIHISIYHKGTLDSGGIASFESGYGNLEPFASRFYKLSINNNVDTFRIDYSGMNSITKPILQVILVEQGNVVRDIIRTDKDGWSRTIANNRSGKFLDHIMIMLTAIEVGGHCKLMVSDVPPAPDVMVTRWNTSVGKSYEIDSLHWAWTWASPDIYVDNNSDGIADPLQLRADNLLFIQLHNQGHADANNISVRFWYQPVSGPLIPQNWLPLTDSVGNVQELNNLFLPAETSGKWSVNWNPGIEDIPYSIKATVTVPGDPNTDNKQAMSNFANITIFGPTHDFIWERKFPNFPINPLYVQVIPRFGNDWALSDADQENLNNNHADRGKNFLRLYNKKVTSKTKATKKAKKVNVSQDGQPLPLEMNIHRVDPTSLPPGMGNTDMVTINFKQDGRVINGYTWGIHR